jgi:hypothetical protein
LVHVWRNSDNIRCGDLYGAVEDGPPRPIRIAWLEPRPAVDPQPLADTMHDASAAARTLGEYGA